MLVGERVAKYRGLAGISTRELDRLAVITQGHTSNIERSKTGNVELKTLDKVARVLGVSLDLLIRGEGDEPTEEALKASVEAARKARSAGEEATEGTGTDGGE